MRRMFSISALIVLLIFAAAFISHSFGQTANSEDPGRSASGEQWEYLIVAGGTTNLSSSTSSSMRKEKDSAFNREWFPLETNMDKLGAKGWELVSVSGNPADPVYFFKRRK
jgi:hypothetical protein